MHLKFWLLSIFLSGLFILLHAEQIFTDSRLGYSITLPDTWKKVIKNDSSHYFYDSLGTYGSRIGIVRYFRDLAVYPAASDWTRAHFIAYKILVDNSGVPFSGYVVYYDSSAAQKLGSNWAPVLYSKFLMTDPLNPSGQPQSWAELLRYISVAGSGYEFYTVGDTTDMLANVGVYDSLMSTVTFTGGVNGIGFHPLRAAQPHKGVPGPVSVYTVSGRRLTSEGEKFLRPAAAQVILTHFQKRLIH